MSNTAYFLLCGVLGVIIHSILKAFSLQKDAQVANLPFNIYKDYIQKDLLIITASVLSVFLWLLLFEEIEAKYVALSGWGRLSFVFMGFNGSYLIQYLASKSKKAIRNIVDVKTNQLDVLKKEKIDAE